MDILRVKNLTKKFSTKSGDFTAVDHISFSLKEGEILGLLGPNGAGKTTTIQMLLGVLTPTVGEIFYFGKKLKEHREEILEHVNFSSAYTELPHRLSVRENFTFISYLYNIKNKKERLNKIVEIFKLHELWNKTTLDLSAGQLTRINLAKAFINFPKILLLDEPTVSLDPDAAKYIREFLLSERKKFQVSIVLTSHNMAEVEEVCDRVIFIDHGKIIADDTPDNLAKSIEISHVELFVKDGLKRTVEYCRKRDLRYRVVGHYIIIDVKEKLIPEFLRDLMSKGVFYDEISIEKPSLEDYFLQVVKTPISRQI
jgi:ABC-2 type transport system ATP-binding protein